MMPRRHAYNARGRGTGENAAYSADPLCTQEEAFLLDGAWTDRPRGGTASEACPARHGSMDAPWFGLTRPRTWGAHADQHQGRSVTVKPGQAGQGGSSRARDDDGTGEGRVNGARDGSGGPGWPPAATGGSRLDPEQQWTINRDQGGSMCRLLAGLGAGPQLQGGSNLTWDDDVTGGSRGSMGLGEAPCGACASAPRAVRQLERPGCQSALGGRGTKGGGGYLRVISDQAQTTRPMMARRRSP